MLRRALVAIGLVMAVTTTSPGLTKVVHYTDKELRCLLANIYYEARGEPLQGQVAVAKVTLNRAANSSICKAVYAKNQFSWTANITKIPKVYDYQIYTAAHLALFTNFEATHYHATYVKPYWSTKLTKLGQIGNHVFYAGTN